MHNSRTHGSWYVGKHKKQYLTRHSADHDSDYDNNNPFKPISLDPARAASLNPTISSDNSTSFRYMMHAAGILNDGFALENGRIVYALESLLSLSVVNGLAQRNFSVNMTRTLLGNIDGLGLVSYNGLNAEQIKQNQDSFGCRGWCSQLLPSGNRMGYGSNFFNNSNIDTTTTASFTMRAGVQGWAFNRRDSAANFTIIALLLHILIAFGHIGYTIWKWKSSSNWGSISELVALAMTSEPSQALENTGAGIDSGAAFENRGQVIDRNGVVLEKGADRVVEKLKAIIYA